MITLPFARILEIALHFVVLGGLTDIALQIHHGRTHEAILHAVIASICVVVLAGGSYFARHLLGKHHSDWQLNVTWVLTRKNPRAKAHRGARKGTRNRRSL